MALKFLFRKKWLLILAVLASAALLAYFVLPALIFNPERLRDAVVAEVQAATGRTLNVKGAAEFSLQPSPVLTLHNVELQPGEDPAKPSPRLRAESVAVQFMIGDIFSPAPRPAQIIVVRPVLEIERAGDGHVYWDWLQPSSMASLPTNFSIQDGKAIYVDPAAEQNARVEEIQLSATPGQRSNFGLKGTFSYQGHKLNLQAVFPLAQPQQAMRAELKLWESEHTALMAHMEYAQMPDAASPEWSGDVDVQLENINAWLPKIEAKESQPGPPAAEAPPPPTTTAPYPLKLSGKLNFAEGRLTAKELTLKMDDSVGKGEISLLLAETPVVDVRLEFEQLKIASSLLTPYFAKAKPDDAEAGPIAEAEMTPKLPGEIRVGFDAKAQSVSIDSRQLTNVTLQGTLDKGELAVTACEAHLPGDTVISLAGKVVETARGLRFQGNTVTSGKDFRAALATLDTAAEKLPEPGFGEFYLAANVFISSEQLRLSEAELDMGDLKLNGGMVTYFEAVPRMEAEVSLKNINLDYFRDHWREEVKNGQSQGFIFTINSSVDFSWLRSLVPIIDLKLNLEGFTFLDKTGDSASLRFYAQQNAVGLHQIEMHYPDGILKGDVKVSVENALPNLAINVEVPRLDTAYWSADGKQQGQAWVYPEGAEGRWSTELFDFSWMIGVTANVNVSAQRFIHHGEPYDRFLLQADLNNEALQIHKLNFERYGGTLDFSGTLTGGKVPGVSGNFTFYNADTKALLSGFSSVGVLSGRASFSGSLATSGTSLLEWIRQADAKMVLAGRNVRTEGFNLQGVVDATLASHSVAQVVENVDKALPRGSTEFSIDGNLNLAKGALRTPGLAVQSPQSVGTLTGEVLLVPWKMALNSVFQMNTLRSETVPTFTVDITGTPDKYSLQIDTSSLEAFVAKRVVGK